MTQAIEQSLSTPTHTIFTEQDREPLSGPLAHYESKVLATQMAINPLVAAAVPLLNLEDAVTDTIHEVKSFESQAHQQGYPAATILAARYLLCCLVDERHSNATLLHYFQHESWGGERFFTILARASESPRDYIDLLELGYFCLSQGYEGKYQQSTDKQALNRFTDQLYQLIRQHRQEQQPLLMAPQKQPLKYSLWAAIPAWWVTILAASGVLLGIFIPYYYALNKSMTPITQAITVLLR